jgi:hypothetical protein
MRGHRRDFQQGHKGWEFGFTDFMFLKSIKTRSFRKKCISHNMYLITTYNFIFLAALTSTDVCRVHFKRHKIHTSYFSTNNIVKIKYITALMDSLK